jgi:hypothetical protein
MVDSSSNEFLAAAAFFVGTVIATVISYLVKKPPAIHHDAVVAGVGIELGNRMQTDQMITELKRIGDSLAVLADRKQAAVDDKLEEILERLDEKERRN